MTNKKSTLIFLHGWGGSITSWNENLPYFQNLGFECHAIKLPGFDLSEPSQTWGIPEYSDFVIENIADISKEPCVVIGHSFGGRIATYIASHRPELIKKLILTDSAGINLEPKLVRKTLITVSRLFKLLEDKIPVLNKLRAKAVATIGSKDYKDANPKMREIMKKVVNLDLRPNLRLISCPTLIIWGDEDRITPIKMAETFRVGIKHSVIYYIKGAGHHAHSEKPREWNLRVEKFLNQ